MKHLPVSQFAVGDRVAVEYDEGDWCVGTVSHVRNANKITVLEDDGDEEEWDLKEEQVLKLDPKTKRYRNVLTHTQVMRLVNKEINVGYERDAGETEEELALKAQYTDVRLFLKCAHSKTAITQYFWKLWRKANRVHFNGRLKEPTFKFLKDMGKKAALNGRFRRQLNGTYRVGSKVKTYDEDRGTLFLSPRIFNGLESHAIVVIIHEMCHQAAFEIDGATREPNQNHGPTWNKWMRHCGLTPSRYVSHDKMQNLKDGAEIDDAIDLPNWINKMQQTHEGYDFNNVRAGDWIQFIDQKARKMTEAVLVCAIDQNRLKWAVIENEAGRDFTVVGWTVIMKMPQQKPLSQAMLRKINAVNEHYSLKDKMKRLTR